MTQTSFDRLAPNAKIWVFCASRSLTGVDRGGVIALAEKVMDVWAKKQPMLGRCWELRDDRFLIVGADATHEELDGCTVDAMMHWVLRFEAESGLKLVDRVNIYYRDADGNVQSCSRPEFRKRLGAGEVTPATVVFDTAISRVDSLREGRFELPMEQCWHAELFLSNDPART